MGAQQSAPVVEEVGESTPPAAAKATTIKLYRFDDSSNLWELEAASVNPHFYNVNEDSTAAKPKWYLEVADAETEVTDQFNFEESGMRVIFQGEAIWALRFPNARSYQDFHNLYNDKLFENTFGVENDEANRQKVFGKDSVLNLGQKESKESRDMWAQDMDVDDKPSKEEVFKQKQVTKQKDAIHGVRLGAGDRSYLIRNNRIDVLRNQYGGVEDANVSFDVTPPKGGGSFTPNKMLLMNSERRMNMLSPTRGEKLFNADIETGKILNEWSFKKDGQEVAMKDIVNDSKGAQLDDRDTFLGVGQNRIVKWDMRDPSGVVDEMNSPVINPIGGKDYARNTNFNCMATSGDGFVVVGSQDGQVRMYSERQQTRANTAIPGLGAPITSVDVTFDGKWVLATTNNYLMVVKTTFKDKNDKETNAFRSRMGQRAPAPRLLRLKPEDSRVVKGAHLSKGKFTWITESGKQERWIVVSCGNYTVLWNFRQVKLAKPDVVSYGGLTTVTNYHLIPKNENVVDSVFMHDNFANSPGRDESAMVVVTDDQLYSLAHDD